MIIEKDTIPERTIEFTILLVHSITVNGFRSLKFKFIDKSQEQNK